MYIYVVSLLVGKSVINFSSQSRATLIQCSAMTPTRSPARQITRQITDGHHTQSGKPLFCVQQTTTTHNADRTRNGYALHALPLPPLRTIIRPETPYTTDDEYTSAITAQLQQAPPARDNRHGSDTNLLPLRCGSRHDVKHCTPYHTRMLAAFYANFHGHQSTKRNCESRARRVSNVSYVCFVFVCFFCICMLCTIYTNTYALEKHVRIDRSTSQQPFSSLCQCVTLSAWVSLNNFAQNTLQYYMCLCVCCVCCVVVYVRCMQALFAHSQLHTECKDTSTPLNIHTHI